jgi:predicted dehydrogenase
VSRIEALEKTIASLRAGGRLTDTHAAAIDLARGLADAVTIDSANASLWREYRAAVASLMEADGDRNDDDETQAFLVAVRAPVGHTKKPAPANPRTRDRGSG